MESEAHRQLKAQLQAVHPLSEEVYEAFLPLWKPFEARRKELLSLAGEQEKYLYFTTEGVQRVYALHGDKDVTIVFTYAPSFGGILDSVLLQTPSAYYYETLTPSRFLRIPVSRLHEVLRAYPEVETLMRKGLAFTLSGLMERLAELQCMSSEEKFRALLRRSPHILQLVPHKYLAGYIGIDTTNFSKLMNRVHI